MLESRRLELQAQMDAAYTEGDNAKIEALRRTIDRETLECTAHTAERLKRVERNVSEIKDVTFEMRDSIKTSMGDIKRDISDIKKTVADHDPVVKEVKEGKLKAKGAWSMLRILAWIAAVGGSGAVGYIFSFVQKASEK